MAQIEKDLKLQLQNLKDEVDKAAKEKQALTKLGAIQLTVQDAEKTDEFNFDVSLEGPSGKISESVTGSKDWTRIGLPPGQYNLRIQTKSKGVGVSSAIVIDVKPGETSKTSLTIPVPQAR